MMGLQALMRSCHAGHDGDNASNPMMALPPRAPAEVTCAICRPLLLGAYLHMPPVTLGGLLGSIKRRHGWQHGRPLGSRIHVRRIYGYA